ncbi:MAG: hypothetical protein JW937_03490 [Candidatus Omnitrophica bacterium]|nr:hypothetical protein [Candidatus Omnitrophota bacterium]
MPYSVFLKDESFPLPIEPVSRVLHQVLGGVMLDYFPQLKLHYGWIAKDLDLSTADALLAALESAGFPALKKEDSEPKGALQLYAVKKAELKEDFLYAQIGITEALTSVPWHSLSIVSIGSVPITKQKSVVGEAKKHSINWGVTALTGIPVSKTKTVKTTRFENVSEQGVLIHLIFAQEKILLEIRPTAFNYAYLKERLATNSRENFKTLLQDLQRFATQACWTRVSRKFLETGELKPDFVDAKDFLRYNSWILEKS